MRRFLWAISFFLLCGGAGAEAGERRDLSDTAGETGFFAGGTFVGEGEAGALLFPPTPDLPNPFSPGFGQDSRALDGRRAGYRVERLPELGVDVSLGARAAAMSGVDQLTIMLRASGDMEAGERLRRWRASAGASATDGPVSFSAGLSLVSETRKLPTQFYGGLSVSLDF